MIDQFFTLALIAFELKVDAYIFQLFRELSASPTHMGEQKVKVALFRGVRLKGMKPVLLERTNGGLISLGIEKQPMRNSFKFPYGSG
jgi:hypothetical protein